MTPAEVELLTIDDLAALAKESRSTIKRRIKDKRIEVVHLSARAVRIRPRDAAAYLENGAADASRLQPSNVHPLRP